MRFRNSFALFLLAGAYGCGTAATRSTPLPQGMVEAEQARQRELALADVEHHQGRLDSIAFPLMARATSLCPGAAASRIGMLVATVYDYDEPWREAARTAFTLGDTMAVLSLVKEGPAGDAGLRSGDRLLTVNGREIPVGAGASAAFASALAQVRRAGTDQMVIGYRRAGEKAEVTVGLVPGCDYGTLVIVGGELNAYADGRNILVTSTMMRFAGDDELRVIVAHELAHNARGHIGARQRSALVRLPPSPGISTGGYLTSEALKNAGPSFSPDAEREADYVGLYALAIAGYPLDPAPHVWRHVAQADPEGIGIAGTHPTPAERFVRMEQAIAEIERKRATGAPLTPDGPLASARPAPMPAPVESAPPSRATAEPELPPQASEASPGLSEPPISGKTRTTAELQIDRGLRETLSDVTRLGIAEAYEEAEPGLLVLVLSPNAFGMSSTEYNLQRLYLAYDHATLYPEIVAIELWQGGRAIGRYTRAGMILQSESPATGDK